MNKEKNSIVIQQVNEEIFDDFLGLIDKLSEYEKLAPPNEEARRRLRISCLSDKPKYQALVGKAYDASVDRSGMKIYWVIPTIFMAKLETNAYHT